MKETARQALVPMVKLAPAIRLARALAVLSRTPWTGKPEAV